PAPSTGPGLAPTAGSRAPRRARLRPDDDHRTDRGLRAPGDERSPATPDADAVALLVARAPPGRTPGRRDAAHLRRPLHERRSRARRRGTRAGARRRRVDRDPPRPRRGGAQSAARRGTRASRRRGAGRGPDGGLRARARGPLAARALAARTPRSRRPVHPPRRAARLARGRGVRPDDRLSLGGTSEPVTTPGVAASCSQVFRGGVRLSPTPSGSNHPEDTDEASVPLVRR